MIGLGVLVLGLCAFIFGGEFLIDLYLRGESKDIDPVLTMEHAKSYLGIMLWGLPAFVLTQIYAGTAIDTAVIASVPSFPTITLSTRLTALVMPFCIIIGTASDIARLKI